MCDSLSALKERRRVPKTRPSAEPDAERTGVLQGTLRDFVAGVRVRHRSVVSAEVAKGGRS